LPGFATEVPETSPSIGRLTAFAGLRSVRSMPTPGAQPVSRGARAVLSITLGMLTIMASDSGRAQTTTQAGTVAIEKVSCLNLPNCYKLSNGEVEVVVTTDIGPRVARYGFVGGDNILGELPGSLAEKDRNTWQSWGGHRLWIAPEGQPKSYGPDNSPIAHTVSGNGSTIRLEQPVEPATHIQKAIEVTLDAHGSGVSLRHTLTNRGSKPFELAPWALTVMNPGGTAIIPQEPYESHDTALLPARPMVLWHYTDLADPRFKFGPKFLRLSTDAGKEPPQKIGVGNKQGWVAYARNGLLFVKKAGYQDGRHYPDFGCNFEVYTAGNFMEVESLGSLQNLAPGQHAEHVEHWTLTRDVKIGAGDTDAQVETALKPALATGAGAR
jgi:hypothetical protein